MRVLFFSGDYYPDPGGIAVHVYYLSRSLARMGLDVTVVGGHRTARKNFCMKEDVFLNEYTFERKGPFLVRGSFFLLRAWLQIMKLSNIAWDVVHFHNFIPDGLLIGMHNLPPAKVRVFTNHSDILLKTLDRRKNTFLLRLLIREVNGIIAPSPELRDKSSVIQHHGQIIEYIPNGVDINKFRPGDATAGRWILGLEDYQKVVIAVRRHDPKCGLPWLIRAIPTVLDRHPEALFVFVGDGVQTPTLMSMVKEIGVEKAVRFLGRVSHDKLPALYRAACVSVLPSLYEAVSLSGLESLASGVPVIGTSVGGIPEFVKNEETGWLIPPRSSEALANAIIEALDAPEKCERMSKRGRELVVEEFSWDKVAEKTISFYQKLGATKNVWNRGCFNI